MITEAVGRVTNSTNRPLVHCIDSEANTGFLATLIVMYVISSVNDTMRINTLFHLNNMKHKSLTKMVELIVLHKGDMNTKSIALLAWIANVIGGESTGCETINPIDEPPKEPSMEPSTESKHNKTTLRGEDDSEIVEEEGGGVEEGKTNQEGVERRGGEGGGEGKTAHPTQEDEATTPKSGIQSKRNTFASLFQK